MNTNLPQEHESFIAGAKELLNESILELDTATTRRLQQARVRALTAQPAHRWLGIWASGLTMAAVGVLSLTIWLSQATRERPHPPQFDDLELISSSENVELADDLEFYHWLADADATG
ncbi:MAG TPA: hypothetical protein VH681_15220 [Nitrospiraceae bacterium]|jgi:hypothetical protein